MFRALRLGSFAACKDFGDIQSLGIAGVGEDEPFLDRSSGPVSVLRAQLQKRSANARSIRILFEAHQTELSRKKLEESDHEILECVLDVQIGKSQNREGGKARKRNLGV